MCEFSILEIRRQLIGAHALFSIFALPGLGTDRPVKQNTVAAIVPQLDVEVRTFGWQPLVAAATTSRFSRAAGTTIGRGTSTRSTHYWAAARGLVGRIDIIIACGALRQSWTCCCWQQSRHHRKRYCPLSLSRWFLSFRTAFAVESCSGLQGGKAGKIESL